jgi:hypothetical protein
VTLSNKLEVLGQVSERARAIEGQADPVAIFAEAVFQVNHYRHERWPLLRRSVELAAAAAVNWILVGDGGGMYQPSALTRGRTSSHRPAPRPHSSWCGFPAAACWCGAFSRKVPAWG